MPPRDRDRLDFVHLELCTNALILNGIGAPPLKRQVCAAARWSRSLLGGGSRARTCPAPAQASIENSNDFALMCAGAWQVWAHWAS